MEMGWMEALPFTCVVMVMLLSVKICKAVWWNPMQMKRKFELQGIHGPPYKLLYGNMVDMMHLGKAAMSSPMPLSHDIIPRALTFYHTWSLKYGKSFVHWFGTTPRVTVTEPEVIWEVLCNKSGVYKKSKQMKHLNGDGLISLEGDLWAHHRRIINPAFHVEHLKRMVPMMIGSTTAMLDRWEEAMKKGWKEVEICKEFQNLTEDLLAHTVFGSGHAEGRLIFDMQAELTHLATEIPRSLLFALVSRFLPLRKNRHAKSLDKKIRISLRKLIERKQKDSCGRQNSCDGGGGGGGGGDLLSVMSNSNNTTKRMSIEEIIDECQTFFFAGHDTTLCLLVWSVVLLAMHPQWQHRARQEALSVCGANPPKPENLNHLKLMGMILNESLRLYPPVVALIRQGKEEMKVGKARIPGGTQLLLPIIAMHHDKSLWGHDAAEFNPERFGEGIAKAAKHRMAFMPFGLGPRNCVGQNFALLQAKIILTMILQRFSFSLSPSYVHAPICLVFLQPQYGAQITLHPL